MNSMTTAASRHEDADAPRPSETGKTSATAMTSPNEKGSPQVPCQQGQPQHESSATAASFDTDTILPKSSCQQDQSQHPAYRIGIDAGSKTVKMVVLDAEGKMVYSIYRRHDTNIKKTLAAAFRDLLWRLGDITGTLAVTGSAGIAVAELLGVPFVQEVVATVRAVRESYPEADAIVELGGEDAKVAYLTGPVEQRMNATCAGGTGGFLDTMAYMLGVRTAELGRIALGHGRRYPIASRCAVFAQTDVRALLNAGASKPDIAASALDAVVRQTLGGLACGRPLSGTVVFLGGPFEHIPNLYSFFRSALKMDHEHAIKPKDAHLFTVCGAALISDDARPEAGRAPVTVTMGELNRALLESGDFEQDETLERLPALFDSDEELEAFRIRHGQAVYPTGRLYDCRGPLYLGIDAGSTAIKIAVVDGEGTLVHHDYELTRGDTVVTLRDMLLNLYTALPKTRYNGSEPSAWIARAAVTGYGEDMLRAGLGVDDGVVETAAHLRAARQMCPDVTFLLDIGGQDMKALWVKDGQITDAVLNEACSSGCGAFISGTAHGLHLSPAAFSEAALAAHDPVDLGIRCTVFMSSRVKHAQKAGATRQDLAAGVAYSVVKNALFRIISPEKAAAMGPKVMVQGGTFKSDAVLRAFEKICGIEAIRPDRAHLMGAIGAALTAKDEAEARAAEECPTSSRRDCPASAENSGAGQSGVTDDINAQPRTGSDGDAGNAAETSVMADKVAAEATSMSACSPRSGLIDSEGLEALTLTRKRITCEGCENLCALTLVDFGNGRLFVNGNRCPKGERLATDSYGNADSRKAPEGNGASAADAAGRGQTIGAGGPSAADAADSSLTAGGNDVSAADDGARTEHAPDIVRLEQQLLAEFGDTPSLQPRADRPIGLMNTLEMYEAIPFWHRFLTSLGFSVAVPAADSERSAPGIAWETVPSESVCFPAKISHSRLYSLMDKGAGALFMPRFARGRHCPVSCGYGDALADNVEALRDGSVAFLSPELPTPKPQKLASDPAAAALLEEALAPMAEACGQPLEPGEAERALAKGLRAQRDFERRLQRETEAALEWIAAKPRRHGIVLAGRPYHADPVLNHGIDAMLQELGYAVLSPLGLGERLKDVSGKQSGEHPWKPAKHLSRLGRLVAGNPSLDMVSLLSFGCGYDAMSLEEVGDELSAAGKPLTVLKVDEMVDTAHIRIRLRTLDAAIRARRRAALTDAVPGAFAGRSAGAVASDGYAPESTANLADTAGNRSESSSAQASQLADIAAPTSGQTTLTDTSISGEIFALDQPLDARDLDTARTSTVKDVCFTANILAARCIRLLRENPQADTLVLPAVCVSCLDEAIPRMVERAVERPVRIRWEQPAVFNEDADPCLAAGAENSMFAVVDGQEGRRPRIGLVGNPLLVFDPFMNDHLADLLDELGVEAVFPDRALMVADDVRYEDQLEQFCRQGIRQVVYLQSFGCLKGHVQSRGALHHLAEQFPELAITVLDYDPEASALNRENRIRLIAETAFEQRDRA